MPVYNGRLSSIDSQEAKRYAGIRKAVAFPTEKIEEACSMAQLLSHPQACWEIYPYQRKTQNILSDIPLRLQGNQIGKHLEEAEKVIVLAATIGKEIEEEIHRCFQEGRYTDALLLDAAATAAVEQTADTLEKILQTSRHTLGYQMNWRYSPGYGDWPLQEQEGILRLSGGQQIGLSLTESFMLFPRKSITAIIGLSAKKRTDSISSLKNSCQNCSQKNCLARKKDTVFSHMTK